MTTTLPPQVAVVDFNHHRGPEIELWVHPIGEELFSKNSWTHLPFLALPDGAHASSEEFSYFTLLRTDAEVGPSTTLFGISCTRQIRADKLKTKSAEVTRSFVQKAVVVLVSKPGALGQIRERLANVTAAWFAQEDFSNSDILKEFQASLSHGEETKKDDKDAYFGLSLRELLYDLRYQTLILFKCLLLQKRMLFFGTKCERLCMTQFALISLIPHLLENLQDSASPNLDTYSIKVSRATNLRTSERSSLLAYMGLPLQIFGQGAFFTPYTPLQQLDFLSSSAAKSYVAGSTNTLFLAQRDLDTSVSSASTQTRYCDILVNLDEPNPSSRLTILTPALRSALSLSAADRRWIDHLAQTVQDTYNPADPSRPTNHGYQGSEDAIRLSFEEYILSLLSSTAYKSHFDNHPNPYLSTNSGGVNDSRYPDPAETAQDFNPDFLAQWRQTPNYKLWQSLTSDAGIFDIVEPRHPTAGGLNIEDVQRRVGAAVAELHLDDKTRQARETAGRALEVGRERVGAGVARFWSEVERLKERRDASRNRENQSQTQKANDPTSPPVDSIGSGVAVTTHDDVFDASRPSTDLPGDTATSTTNTAQPPSNSPSQVQQPSSSATVGTGMSASWATALRTRAANVQLQRPNVDTTQMSAAARENAAKAGAYLSSWGSWAKERGREWQGSGSGSVAGSGSGVGQRSVSLGTVVSTADAADGGAGGNSGEARQGVTRQVSTSSSASSGAIAAARKVMSPGGASASGTGAGAS